MIIGAFINLLQERSKPIRDFFMIVREPGVQIAAPEVLALIRKWGVGKEQVPGKMRQCPTIGLHELMLCKPHSFEVSRLSAAAAAVRDRSTEASLLIENACAVANE